MIVRLGTATVAAAALLAAAPAGAHVSTDPGLVTTTYGPTDDATVRADAPTTPNGSAAVLFADGQPVMRTYLRFQVQGLTGPVARAVLRLQVRNSTGTGISVGGAGHEWDERTLTWDGAPPAGDAVASSGPIAAAGAIELDVTELVKENGAVAMVVDTGGVTRVGMASSEDAAASPRLVVESSDGQDVTPPATPSGLDARATAGAVALTWDEVGEPDLAGYRIYRRSGDGDWPAEPVGLATASTWSEDGLQDGTALEYRVTAIDAAGNESAPATSVRAVPGRHAGELAFPVRAAFYHPRYPEGWRVGSTHQPSLGFYDSSDASAVDAHVRALDYGRFDVAIATWSGPGTHQEGARIPLLLDRTRALGSDLKWALYYDKEALSDPTVEALRADLAYVKATYASRPEYAHVDGRPVLFVYNNGDIACDLADRWKRAARDGWYVVLKVIPGWSDCAAQPAAWHQYGPSTGEHQHDDSYVISPGYWRAADAAPRLARDPAEWRARVRRMVASGLPWQLVTTFNHWVQGTAVESAGDWDTPSGQGSYLDALHDDGAEPDPDPLIAAAGDIADADFDAEGTAQLLDVLDPDAVLTTGDNAYPVGAPLDYASFYDPTWGRHRAKTRPVPGNHEYITPGAAGYFGYFGAAAGDPATGYYAYDLGRWRLYALNSNVAVSATSAQLEWLRQDLAANPRPCVLAYWHHPRFSAGEYADDARYRPLWQALYDAGAEIVLAGHDHNYQRYVPLRPDGIPDAERGLREFVVGTGGKSHYALQPRADGLREAADDKNYGVLALELRSDGYRWDFVPDGGGAPVDTGAERCH